jgi:hypothetical protein
MINLFFARQRASALVSAMTAGTGMRLGRVKGVKPLYRQMGGICEERGGYKALCAMGLKFVVNWSKESLTKTFECGI